MKIKDKIKKIKIDKNKSIIHNSNTNHNIGCCDNENIVLIKPKFLVIQIIKNIIVKDKEKTFLIDIYYENWLGKQEELRQNITFRLLCRVYRSCK